MILRSMVWKYCNAIEAAPNREVSRKLRENLARGRITGDDYKPIENQENFL